MGHLTVSQGRLLRLARKIALIMLGTAIFTFGVHNIHEVTGITEGGVIGLMLFLNRWFGVSAAVASPLLDILCYAIALKVLGGRFLGWSAVATCSVALFYGFWEQVPRLLPDLSGDPLLAAVLGGVLVGAGVGIVVRQGGSAGGDDALALSLSKLLGCRVAHCYLFTDLTVLALSLSYIPFGRIAWSLVTVAISSALIDVVGTCTHEQLRDITASARAALQRIATRSARAVESYEEV